MSLLHCLSITLSSVQVSGFRVEFNKGLVVISSHEVPKYVKDEGHHYSDIVDTKTTTNV